MLPTKLLIVFILNAVHKGSAEDEGVMIKLHPDQIINTFKSVISSKYLQELADDFAAKAARHFIDAIRHKGKELSVGYSKPIKEKKEMKPKAILNEREVMTLLKEPSPDGDNFDSFELSKEDSKTIKKKKKIPVIELRKINGIYYRRLLGLI